MNTFCVLNNLLCQFIHGDHIAYLKVGSTCITVMGKTVLSHFTVTGKQAFVTIRTLASALNTSGHVVNMDHLALFIFSPGENKVNIHTSRFMFNQSGLNFG